MLTVNETQVADYVISRLDTTVDDELGPVLEWGYERFGKSKVHSIVRGVVHLMFEDAVKMLAFRGSIPEAANQPLSES
jgi:hypothetical protein